MIGNIFNKKDNNIFYIKMWGDVYEMKFVNIVIPMGVVKPTKLGNVVLTDKGIVTLRVNIASLGERLWFQDCLGQDFPVTGIYKTLEDCINGVNPLFKWNKYKRFLKFTDAISPIVSDTKEMLMDGAYWKEDKDLYGIIIKQMWTYQWDGTKVISKRIYAPNTAETNGLVFINTKEVIHYDLVNEQHIVDSEYKKTCYATYEECVNDNFVKVHRF